MTTPDRPDPDRLLARAQADAARALRGKLTIYFGASAGVGKTYAMLKAGQRLREQQVDVVVGLVETHRRAETAALLDGLDVLPLRQLALPGLPGQTIGEFDLDAALARHPAVLLVDELAHSNAAGSRHPRRWQDIDELLDAGIDVLTTVNVQHLESLNDVVGGITGVRVFETVPDHVFDDAFEVVLVDLPPDDLLRRLKEGRVYQPEQAERAAQNFFRKGNLMALRELALRRTAERVDDEVRTYRREQAGDQGRAVWQVVDAQLVCIGPDLGGDRLVRAAARRAVRSGAPWHAVYVETPSLQRLPDAKRRHILRTLKLAEGLGASTATLSGQDAAAVATAYAREHNLGTLVAGRRSAPQPGGLRWPTWQIWGGAPFARRAAELAPEIDLMLIARGEPVIVPANDNEREGDPLRARNPWPGIGWAVASTAAVTLVATPLRGLFDLANIVMLFLLAVVVVAVRYGRRPALASAVLNVVAFDFFFVQPRFSFAIADAQYLLTFAVMMIVGLVVGQLTANLRYQARVSRYREDRARNLFEMARELGQALTREQVAETGEKYVRSAFRGTAALLFPDEHERLLGPAATASASASAKPGGVSASVSAGAMVSVDADAHAARATPVVVGADSDTLDLGLAQWCFDHAAAAGAGTDTLPASPQLYVPLNAPMRTRGVIAVRPDNPRLLMIPEQRRLLDTFVALVAMAVERVHFVTVAQDTLVEMSSERLRNSLLAALSHDLRTPLTAIVGQSQNLSAALRKDTSPHAEAADAIAALAVRTAQLVSNLLDMARLQAGAITLRRDWESLEELVGSALRSIAPALEQHTVRIDLPPDLPLVHGDAVLLERVLVNLLENAAKYTPPGTPITLRARIEGHDVVIEVIDDGPGLPAGMTGAERERLFDTFVRGEKESSTPGVGLGLAICRAIVEAHGGTINAIDRAPPAHGACFRWTLPHVASPAIDAQAALAA